MEAPPTRPRPAVDDLDALRRYRRADPRLVELVGRLAAHHPYSARHSLRVALLVEETARQAGLDESTAAQAYEAALVHDLGKVEVPTALLDAPRALTDEERLLMEGHPAAGARLLAAAGLAELSAGAHEHHERYDGQGYPRGLTGTQISEWGRLIAVADVFEALTAPERRYREPLAPAAALAVVAEGAGRQFDPALVTALSQGHAVLTGRPPLAGLESTPATHEPAHEPSAHEL